MSIYKKVLKFKLSITILLLLIITILILIILYFNSDEKQVKYFQLIGGLTSGFIVVLIQFLFNWTDYTNKEKIKNLGVSRILTFRDDETIYREFIQTSKSRLWIMGVTASRFMQDFADDNRTRADKRVVIELLKNRVSVRILVPYVDFLPERDKSNFEIAKKFFEKVKGQYSNFEYRYFKHIPAHSIFVVDEECLLGPVFPNIASKDSPCIQIKATCDFAIKYLQYFETEWENAKEKS